MNVFVSRLPDNPNAVGFQYGPVVLSAALGTEDLNQAQTGIMVKVPTRRMLIKDFLIPTGMLPDQWLEGIDRHLVKEGSELVFKLRNTDEDDRLIFTPHFKQHEERYGIYWNIVESDSKELKRHLEQASMEQLVKEATIDSVQVGNDQYELQHAVKGEGTVSGAWEGQNGRNANPGGWFSYELKVIPGMENLLQVTYLSIHNDRVMHIYANGELLTSERSAPVSRREFVTKYYSIPEAMINGRDQVEFKFVPEDKRNGIYGVLRTMRSDYKE
ncbi:hypothetical protein QFZ81_004818 [Paenibacillus sp. V4I9]|nr:DUF6805 domain-containing protein [Paenibacillus sp. V4I9]MDQ0889730.1 hypothetical protein [Paenibacillus sp. V4I9]